MKLYKLTGTNNQTRRNTIWGPGVTNYATPGVSIWTSPSPQLCTDTVIHAYVHPLQMLACRKQHGYGHATVKLWEAEGEVVVHDDSKVGVQALTTIKEIPLYFKGYDDWVASAAWVALSVENALHDIGMPGHPRTGSKPLRALRVAVAGVLRRKRFLGFYDAEVLAKTLKRMRPGPDRDRAFSLAGAYYERAWPRIQPMLEAARQRNLAKRRERDRARRTAKRQQQR